MKKSSYLFVLIFVCFSSVTETVAADGEGAGKSEAQYIEELKNLVKEGEEKGRAKGEDEPLKVSVTAPQLPAINAAKAITFRGEESSNEMILSLLDQVERLKSKVVVTKANTISTETPKRSMKLGSKTIYPFIEGKLYEVHAGVDKVTDISLAPGEKLTNAPMAGDTVRWKVGLLMSGSEKETSHVIVKPLESDLETNLIITTDKRIYHIRLLSGDWYMPTVSWEYPEEEKSIEELLREKRATEEEEQISLPPEKLRFDYEIQGDEYAFTPEVVFDDGEKTYIRMGQRLKGGEAPALFVLGENDEPILINYRVKGQFYIVDRLFERAELRIGQEKVVTILSPLYERGFFEGLF